MVRRRAGFLFFAALFLLFFSSCASSSYAERTAGGSVPCPESLSSVGIIKNYISSMRGGNPFLQGIYDRLFSGIFRDALDSLELGDCPVRPMYEWMNFCDGLTENTGATALTYGYRDSVSGYHLVLLVDSGFLFSSEGVIAGLVGHEMIHAYCDHCNLPAGKSFHEQWFDYIASALEKQSLKHGSDPFYLYLRTIYRE